MELTRRTFVRGGIATAAVVTTAGCSAPPLTSTGDDRAGYAAFFALWDWAETIAGEEMTFENPVPAGRAGHGFDPEGDLVRSIADTAAFIYLDTPEFGWAQDIATQLRSDYSSIAVIDGLAGFTADDLLAFERSDDIEPDRDHDWDPAAVEVADVDVIDPNTGGVTAYWHGDHWDGGIREIALDGELALEVVVEDQAGRVLPLGRDEPFQLDARLAEDAPEGIVSIDAPGDRVELGGLDPGRTLLVIQVLADGEVVWESAEDALRIEVVEELDAVDVDEFFDPHVWVDPILAMDIVDNIAAGLGEVLPDEAAGFTENAAAYKERLADVDAQFQDLVADAERTTAVLAGHDSFRYLERRYGFDLHAPRGVSPDHRPSQSEIAETIDLIDAEGIDTILYDPFESPDPGEDIPPLAETLLESHENVTEVAPITPVEGTIPAWRDEGWGWVEQMEEVNLPSLRQALGAT